MPDSERRSASRLPVLLGAEIETPDGRVRSAVSKDASPTGLLLLTRAELAIGDKVRLHVHRSDTALPPLEVEGHVVRSEALDESEALLWRRKVAVAIENMPPELFHDARELAEHQAKIYHTK